MGDSTAADVVDSESSQIPDSATKIDADGVAADTLDGDTGTPSPLEFDASLWNKPNPCQGEKSFPEDNTEFAIPDRPPGDRQKLTGEEFIADLGGTPRQASSVRAAANLKPGPGLPYDLFATPGTDVSLSLYVLDNYDDLSTYRLNLAVMVDYQPVRVTYERWRPDRSHVILQREAKGLNFAITSNVEIVDITIPGEVFSEKRMYEISLSYEINALMRARFGYSRRFALYNGGYARPSRPCVEPKLDATATPFEQGFAGKIGDALGVLFYDGIIDQDDVRGLIDVHPGETRSLYLSVLHSDPDEKPTVLVPLLDGKPLPHRWWVTQGGPRDSWRHWKIDARKSFEVTFPEEPGIYEVQVASWTDPYELYRNRDGTLNENVSWGGGLNESSNMLRFRVVEE